MDSSSAITSSAASFGAPVTEPGGNVARSSPASPTPSRSSPSTSETRCHTPACGRDLGERGDADRAGPADAAEVVADEVDDHHVLGAVLLRRGQLGAAVRRARALDRRAAHGAARAGEEQLRREARDRAPGPGDERGAVGRQRRRGGGEQVERVALPAGPPGAGRGSPGTGRRPRSAPGTPRRPRRGRAATGSSASRASRTAAAAGGVGQPRGELGAAARERRLALRGDERLEPPAAGRVEPQHVVVVGERAVGQRHGARRRRVAGLDAVARLEAEEAEPAAADRAGGAAAGAAGTSSSSANRSSSGPGHADRLGAEDRAAARPGADQRERAVGAAQEQRRARRR